MDIEHEVRRVMQRSPDALTVDEVVQAITDRVRDQVHLALRGLVEKGELQSVRPERGVATYPLQYQVLSIHRRI